MLATEQCHYKTTPSTWKEFKQKSFFMRIYELNFVINDYVTILIVVLFLDRGKIDLGKHVVIVS